MKKLLLFALLALTAFGQVAADTPERETALFARLSEVNRYWHDHENAVPSHLLPETNERALIKQHLQLVENALRTTDVRHLSAELQQARQQNLNTLNRYWKSGAFPINTTHAYRLPIFIDPFDNFCAVGFLIKESGHESLSRHISANTNFAYLADMNYPVLDEWAANSGLTKAELAWIQPGYPPSATVSNMLGGTNGTVKALAFDPMHHYLYAGGEFTQAGDQPVNHAAQYGLGFAGPFWTGAGPGLAPTVSAFQWFNGELYAAGSDLLPTGASHSVVKWNGTIWEITAPSTGMVKAMAVYNNQLYAGGTYGNGNAYFARWNGTNWEDLLASSGTSIMGTIYALHVHDNQLYVGGDIAATGINSPNILAYYGSGFTGVAGGVKAAVRALASFNNGLLAGGNFFSAADTFGLALFNMSSWQNLLTSGSMGLTLQPTATGGFISSIVPYGPDEFIVGGNFHFQPMVGVFGQNLVKFTRSANTGYYHIRGLAVLNQPVHALAHDPLTGSLYIGGEFTENMGNSLGYVGQLQLPVLSAPESIQVQEPNIYPNPFSAQTTIQTTGLAAEMPATLFVYDVLGRKVLEQQNKLDANNCLKLSRNQLPAGTYLLQVQQADKQSGMVRVVME